MKKIREKLQETLSCLDFSHMCPLFLVSNDKPILHHDNIQKGKLKNVLKILWKEHDYSKEIFNLS